ncbi:MAG: glycosyltransferase, partial [Novosphingobium sp.]
ERRGHHVALVTDTRGAKLPGKPDSLVTHILPAGRIGKNPLHWPKGIGAILEGKRMAARLFESFQPTCVVGFGGYPAFPTLWAATAAGVPSVIHEQTAVLGRVTRLLAKRVDAIATSFKQVDRLKSTFALKTHLVGNPVRAEVLALRDEPFPPFSEDGLLRVLVTGGSQGASVLAQVVPDALGHRLVASFVATPVAISVAALMVPSPLGDTAPVRLERQDAN